jgi:DNA-binding GntR family transcriptional regulator
VSTGEVPQLGLHEILGTLDAARERADPIAAEPLGAWNLRTSKLPAGTHGHDGRAGLAHIGSEVRLLKERAYDILRQAIISLELRPGEALTERSLTERLGVSKSPIRDALIQLEQERFVRSTPFKGFEVTPLTPDYFHSNFQFREALELYAVEFFITHYEQPAVARLKGNHEEVGALLAHGEPDKAYQSNRFHQILQDAIDNPILLAARRVVDGHLRRIHNVASMISGRMAKTHREHEAILAAIEGRDSEGARRRMRAHIQSLLHETLASDELRRLTVVTGSREEHEAPPETGSSAPLSAGSS